MERLLRNITFNAHYSKPAIFRRRFEGHPTEATGFAHWSGNWRGSVAGNIWKPFQLKGTEVPKRKSGKIRQEFFCEMLYMMFVQDETTEEYWWLVGFGLRGILGINRLDCPMVPWPSLIGGVCCDWEAARSASRLGSSQDHGPLKGHGNKTTQDQLVKRLLDIRRHSQQLFGCQRYPRQKLLSEIGHFSTDSFNIQLTVVWCLRLVFWGSSLTWMSPWNAPCAVDSSAVFKMGSPKHGEQTY